MVPARRILFINAGAVVLYQCFQCRQFGFQPTCTTCGPGEQDHHVPLDPSLYAEFKYESKGLVSDLFNKRRETAQLQSTLDAVLAKYRQLENPYFLNYVHIAHENEDQADTTHGHDRLSLFHQVLIRKGFTELQEFPLLTQKLVRTTRLRFTYADFVRQTERHLSDDMHATMRSWIEERGTVFRTHLPLMLYLMVERGIDIPHVQTHPGQVPMISLRDLDRIQAGCETVYFRILVDRFQMTLERFDPSRFVTIYAIDAMDGYEFEDFLVELFRTIGFDVEQTKKGADQGADLFVERFGRKTVIQAKNYSDAVGNSAVQQALAAKAFYACDKAMVVTNSRFTPSARALAESSGVELVERGRLEDYLDQYNRTLMEAAGADDDLDLNMA